MKKHKSFLTTAICVVLVAAVYLIWNLNSKDSMISQLSETDDPSAAVTAADGADIDIFDHAVPMGELPGDIDPFILEVLELVNAERAGAGAGPLAITGEMLAAAAKRAEELAESFSHYRPDGSVCFTVLNEFGIECSARAENIAGNFKTPQQVVQAWMGSDGHRNNIMNANYSIIGIGVYTDSGGRLSWVQLFTN